MHIDLSACKMHWRVQILQVVDFLSPEKDSLPSLRIHLHQVRSLRDGVTAARGSLTAQVHVRIVLPQQITFEEVRA